jgi:hypothetical protein
MMNDACQKYIGLVWSLLHGQPLAYEGRRAEGFVTQFYLLFLWQYFSCKSTRRFKLLGYILNV